MSSALSRLLTGRASARPDLTVHLSERDGASLHEKARQAYFWIVNNAVITPYCDLEFGVAETVDNPAGDRVGLHAQMSYSSFVLLPLLTLFTARRALLVGGPGRGKTTSATLMALLSGMTRDDVRRAILRGHPQLTIADLLGTPLPKDMLAADQASDIRVAWRSWITARVKIIDEYNRIPTKTQSALLSLMAEGYAEMFDQYVHTGRSSWFLTANDDDGGGTFQVIEALKDRIDVVVRAVPFNGAFVTQLLQRIESGKSPEDLIPTEVVFAADELDRIHDDIAALPVPDSVTNPLSFFLGQLDFCRMASPHFEYKSKDTLKLANKRVSDVCDERCPLDKGVHLCTQTENGVSARTYLTVLHFTKALAWFRGRDRVDWEDVRQITPWVLHDKLVANTRSPYFAKEQNALLLRDSVAWIRTMIDTAFDHFGKHERVRKKVRALRDELDHGLQGVDLDTTRQRMGTVAGLLRQLMKKEELSGPVYEDILHLKSMYSRYQNYAAWLQERAS